MMLITCDGHTDEFMFMSKPTSHQIQGDRERAMGLRDMIIRAMRTSPECRHRHIDDFSPTSITSGDRVANESLGWLSPEPAYQFSDDFEHDFENWE
jgi:hypothetical protein